MTVYNEAARGTTRPEDRPPYECLHCGTPFDPIATRWLCPSCRQKSCCCEGEPL